MLRRFRVRSWSIALTLCIAVGAATLQSLTHLVANHDVECDTPIVAHDANAHAWRAPGSAGQPSPHCAVCHWARSLRLLHDHHGTVFGDAGTRSEVAPRSVFPVAAPPVVHVPARSPPALV